MNAEKLAKLQEQVRIGGKGTPRRKVKKNATGNVSGADKKLSSTLKQLKVQPLSGILEVNMFGDSGKVLHFENPKVHASEQANTFVISGAPTEKEITELVPGILNQLGPDSLASLRKLAETYTSYQKPGEEGDDEIPTLIENFENAEIESKDEAPAAEETEVKESA